MADALAVFRQSAIEKMALEEEARLERGTCRCGES